jgi:carbon-monoxide dehydrogenase large subunit
MEQRSAPSAAREHTRQIGRRIARVEDARLLRGDGRYVADIPTPGALHAYFVRSPVAHACLRAIDAASARSVGGVHSVWAFEDLQRLGVTTLPGGWCHPDQRMTETHLLAIDRLRWVGQPIAVVLAESAYVAEDAAELIVLDVEELPAIVTTDAKQISTSRARSACSGCRPPRWKAERCSPRSTPVSAS